MEKRDLFDRMTMSCITIIQSFEDCGTVLFEPGEAAQKYEISSWEKKNSPYRLPADIKAFLGVFNGIYLHWNVDVGERLISMGQIRVHSLNEIRRIDIDEDIIATTVPKDKRHAAAPQNDSEFSLSSRIERLSAIKKDKCAAFIVDAHPAFGSIVLLCRNIENSSGSSSTGSSHTSSALNGIAGGSYARESEYTGLSGQPLAHHEEPEVWLVDRSSRWHFVCYSFKQYLRLSVAHLGITGWQLVFTPEGLPRGTQQWMAVFCKERLIIDLHCAKELNQVLPLKHTPSSHIAHHHHKHHHSHHHHS